MGGIATDGFFIKSNKKIFYVCYHINSFLEFTSNSTVNYYKTIDGNDKKPLVKSFNNGAFTFIENLSSIHKTGCCDQNHIFIISSARAKNETEKEHDKNTDVDVYSTDQGRYLYSLRLPNYQGHKATSIQCYKKGLVAIQDKNLCYYQIK